MNHRSQIRPATLVPLALLAALLSGCRSGPTATGDVGAESPANTCGKDLHVSSTLSKPCLVASDCPTGICPATGMCTGFIGPAPWFQASNVNSNNCPYPIDLNVETTCLTVTAVDRWDETGNGAIGTVYLQDTVNPTPQYAGISLFEPSFSPPDLRVLPGDVLDVTGTYEEFIGPSSGNFSNCETLPQIAGSAVFRYDGTVPKPVVIQPSDLDSYDNARRYLNMLVTVQNVTIGANGAYKSSRYAATVNVPTGGTTWNIDDELFNLGAEMPLSQGQVFESVTGIVTYFYNFNVAPRSVADFVTAGGPPPPPMDGGTDGG